jgi:hypothetical protein
MKTKILKKENTADIIQMESQITERRQGSRKKIYFST